MTATIAASAVVVAAAAGGAADVTVSAVMNAAKLARRKNHAPKATTPMALLTIAKSKAMLKRAQPVTKTANRRASVAVVVAAGAGAVAAATAKARARMAN